MSVTSQPTPTDSGTRSELGLRPGARNTEEQVRQRAYEIFLSRQREDVPGNPVTDWLRAEQELRARHR